MKNDIIRVGSNIVRFLAEPSDTHGALAMFEYTALAGGKMPVPHYHKAYDETIYGLEGVMTFTVEGKRVPIGKGDSLFIPRGAVHAFDNLTETDAKALAVITPGVLSSNFFKEIAAVLNAGGPPDVAAMKAVMLKHGLVPVPAPSAP